MVYISLPKKHSRLLPFYLAMEEFVARHVKEDDCFFLWQVEPTVIFGRNQLIENEVNLQYCQEHHINTFRRKSGGGCVYADMSNIMFSYITKADNVCTTFTQYINMVVDMLHLLGVDARSSGRNDIMIGNRKVSGNAFYHVAGHSIVHGTMLYDTNMQNMVGSITPSDEKLVSKGVESVRQHIALLKDFISLDTPTFKQFVKDHLCDREFTLTEKDVISIEEIEQEYLSSDFIYGNNPKYTLVRHGRIENVGDMEIRMEVKNDIIKQINIMGDYFLIGDIGGLLIKPLINTPLTKDDIDKALPERLDNIIMNLNKTDFIKLILNN